MEIKDSIYGTYSIEDVLADLLNCSPVQRLKYIHQGGASYLVNSNWNGTRYDHSVGVMLLIRKLGGSIEEQIAGLLHDVSHTAFSHVIDDVFNNKDENYHEQIFLEVIETSDIPAILTKYHYNYKEIMYEIEKWKLLEQPAPELCADRIDYTLRDMYTYGEITLEETSTFLQHLLVKKGKIYINDVGAAEWFVETYYKEAIDFFLHPLNSYGNAMLSKTLQLALQKNYIKESDFLKTDEEIITLLTNANDQEITRLLAEMKKPVTFIEDETNFDLSIKKKERLINPSVYTNNQLIKASNLSDKVTEMNENARLKSRKGVYLRIV